ncbi:archease [Candidatus Auribacterota bacterium]
MKPYHFKDHTADIIMAVSGNSIEELFSNAAEGLAVAIFGEESKEKYRTDVLKTELEDPCREDLLVDWLNEIIFKFYAEDMLYKQACLSMCEEGKLAGDVSWYVIPKQEKSRAKEIKAATYHDLKIKMKACKYYVEILFDV